ncbi:MAG: AAA family ATPase [Spirochaetaceae bacterium]|jgi:ATP-dependent exoDNAse (exonuclease V) alpha subunit|nr:AAA family ATPase [Spirochaetaceae bacterium]
MEIVLIISVLAVIIAVFSAFTKHKALDRLKKENAELRRQSNAVPPARDAGLTGSNIQDKPVRRNIGAGALPDDFECTDEFKTAFTIMEHTRHSLFITGKAGTGKSTLIEYFRRHTNKQVVYLAPTGIAALHIGGKTIHSFFQFKPRLIKKSEITVIKKQADLFKAIEAVVIDEVSMVRADVMAGVDYSLRVNRGRDEPFGGVQMIFVGDLYQLPPVVDKELEKWFHNDDDYRSPWFFDARIHDNPGWFYTSVGYFELQRIFRQDEEKQKQFIDILNALRVNKISDERLALLNTRFKKGYADNPVPNEIRQTICTKNTQANETNDRKLNELPTEKHTYIATITDHFMKEKPTLPELDLKVGAQIMMVKNDDKKRWVNGSLGIVQELDDNHIAVAIDGIRYDVERATWEDIKYRYNRETKEITEEAAGTFTQYPLKLAWAFTIHKSQGQTFDKVLIKPEGAWEFGQIYVAVSRCTSLEGIILDTPIRTVDIKASPEVQSFISTLQRNTLAETTPARQKTI